MPEVERIGEEPDPAQDGVGHEARDEVVSGGKDDDEEGEEREADEPTPIHPTVMVVHGHVGATLTRAATMVAPMRRRRLRARQAIAARGQTT